MINFGLVPAGAVLPIIFDAFAGSTGASVTISGLAVTDIEVYKGTSMTQRSSDAGYTLLDTDGIDLDGVTGIHGFSIDTGDNTDAGFYTAGSFYTVVVSAITVDSQTVNFVAATFRLGTAEGVTGQPKVDVATFGGTAGTFSGGRPEVNTTHWGGTAVASANVLIDGAITAAKIAADAITSAKIADGALTAAKAAAGFFDAVWSVAARLLTAGTNIVLAKGVGVTGFNDLDAPGVRGAVGLAAANLDTQLGTIVTNQGTINTNVLTRAVPGDAMTLTVAERAAIADKILGRRVSGGADGGRSVSQALAVLRNKVEVVAGVLTVYDVDDTTVLFTAAVTQTAGNPISAIDPA